MARKRLTQYFPCLIPLRTWQRNLFYNIGMYLDANKYAKETGCPLSNVVSTVQTKMINESSGQDIKYQYNKVHNLQIASRTMNHILIQPGEVFSFCYLVKHSKRYGEYKDGLILVDGKIVAKRGGGICHLSNLLHELFLQSPLTVIERHGHESKSFPEPDQNALQGVDATVSSGWLDLKVKNETDDIYQIEITFDETYMYATLLCDVNHSITYRVCNENLKYIQQNHHIYECVDIVRVSYDANTKQLIKKEKLYTEKVEITYTLDDSIKVEEMR